MPGPIKRRSKKKAKKRAKKKIVPRRLISKSDSLRLRVAKGLDILVEVDALSGADQSILRSIRNILHDTPGSLRETDWRNMKQLAEKYQVTL